MNIEIKKDEEVKTAAPVEKKESYFWETVKFILLALVIVLPIRFFIAQPFVVSGESMDPTFADGQYLIVDEISYRFENPQRGDVVILKYPYSTDNPPPFYIKRIIGLPGDSVFIDGNTVTIKNAANPNGFILKEPYVANLNFPDQKLGPMTLGDKEYFVMGDNRPHSKDARIWREDGTWGPLPASDIVGRPVFRLLPLSTASVFPGEYHQPASK